MKFLIDVCAASRSMIASLRELDQDVLSAAQVYPGATDEVLLALALKEQRVIITEDKGFGELVFLRGMSHPCIIPFVDMPVVEKVASMRDLVEHHSESMTDGTLIVVTRTRMRIRARNS